MTSFFLLILLVMILVNGFIIIIGIVFKISVIVKFKVDLVICNIYNFNVKL